MVKGLKNLLKSIPINIDTLILFFIIIAAIYVLCTVCIESDTIEGLDTNIKVGEIKNSSGGEEVIEWSSEKVKVDVPVPIINDYLEDKRDREKKEALRLERKETARKAGERVDVAMNEKKEIEVNLKDKENKIEEYDKLIEVATEKYKRTMDELSKWASSGSSNQAELNELRVRVTESEEGKRVLEEERNTILTEVDVLKNELISKENEINELIKLRTKAESMVNLGGNIIVPPNDMETGEGGLEMGTETDAATNAATVGDSIDSPVTIQQHSSGTCSNWEGKCSKDKYLAPHKDGNSENECCNIYPYCGKSSEENMVSVKDMNNCMLSNNMDWGGECKDPTGKVLDINEEKQCTKSDGSNIWTPHQKITGWNIHPKCGGLPSNPNNATYPPLKEGTRLCFSDGIDINKVTETQKAYDSVCKSFGYNKAKISGNEYDWSNSNAPIPNACSKDGCDTKLSDGESSLIAIAPDGMTESQLQDWSKWKISTHSNMNYYNPQKIKCE